MASTFGSRFLAPFRYKRMIGMRALCLATGIVAMLGTSALAQSEYPNRPIHVIVPYPAGGIVDIVARAVTEQVGRDLKQAIVVESRPGANSNIGTSAVARSEPDGYTWLVTGPAVLVNPTLYKDAGRFSRENSSGHQQGAAKSRRSASALDRRHPGQADAAERTRRSHEGGLREADERCQSIGHEAAIGFVRQLLIGRTSRPSVISRVQYVVVSRLITGL